MSLVRSATYWTAAAGLLTFGPSPVLPPESPVIPEPLGVRPVRGPQLPERNWPSVAIAPAPRRIPPWAQSLNDGDEAVIDALQGQFVEALFRGEWRTAVVAAEKWHNVCVAGFGPDHPRTIDSQQWIGEMRRILALDDAGRTELAQAMSDRVTADRERGKNPKRAAELRKSCLATISHRLPGSRLEPGAYQQLAEDYFAEKRPDAALDAVRRAVALYGCLFKSDHPDLGEARTALGTLLYQSSQTEEAEEQFRAALVTAVVTRRDRGLTLLQLFNRYLIVARAGPRPAQESAVAAWREILTNLTVEFGPDLENLHYLHSAAAVLAHQTDQPRTAVVWIENAIRGLRPLPVIGVWQQASYHNLLGAALDRLQQFDRAVEAYRTAEHLLAGARSEEPTLSYPFLLNTVRHNLGVTLSAQGQWDAARDRFEMVLKGWDAIPNVPPLSIAKTQYDLGWNAFRAGDFPESERRCQEAFRRLTGTGVEADELRAQLHSLQGQIMMRRGRYVAAEAKLRASLELRDRTPGQDSIGAAIARMHLAWVLSNQLRFAESVTEAKRSLDRLNELYGPEHHATGLARHSYAHALYRSGEIAHAAQEADAAYRTLRKASGENHPDAIVAGFFLGDVLRKLGRSRDALALFQSLVEPARRLLRNPVHLGMCLANYATLLAQLWDPNWQALFEEALASHRKSGDPYELARGRQVYASCLLRSVRIPGQYSRPEERIQILQKAESEVQDLAQFQPEDDRPEAREIRLAALYLRADCHQLSGEWDDAERCLRRVTDALDRDDPASAGLAVAVRVNLGIVLLHRGELAAAEAQFRLAVKTGDARRPSYGPPSLDRLDPATVMNPRMYLAAVLAKRGQPREAFAELELGLSGNLVSLLGNQNQPKKPSGIEAIQARLSDDTALVAWVDARPAAVEHSGLRFACVLRSRGEPVWVELSGSGPNGRWTEADARVCREYAEALARGPRGLAGDPDAFETRRRTVAGLRITPLKPYLGATGQLPAVRTILAVFPGPLASTPVDTLTDDYVVFYCHSGTAFSLGTAYPVKRPRKVLAFGDPVYGSGASHTPPDTGVVLLSVPPAIQKAVNVRPGDVVRDYNGMPVTTPEEFEAVLRQTAATGAPKVSVIVWRDGHQYALTSPRWEGGIQYSPKRVPEAYAEFRRREVSFLRAVPEPPTRLRWCGPELRAVRHIYDPDGTEQARVWSGDAATLTKVDEERNRPDGWLSTADVLVFALHGRRDDVHPLASALLFAPAPGSGAPLAELPTAGMKGWQTRASVVVLSGCWTGSGTATASDGPLGFTHMVLATGAGSCVVSLWEADDLATALLMTRFHQNLTGRRLGLNEPMRKAEALHEAKRWLRSLTVTEVKQLSTLLDTDPVRFVNRPDPAVRPRGEARPFDDPRYWAAFVLVGQPD